MPDPQKLHARRCECGAADCAAIVEQTWEEQDAADHAGYWVLSPGHDPQGARSWEIIEANDRFVVVEIEEEHTRP